MGMAKKLKSLARSPIGRAALTIGGSFIPGVGPAVGAAIGGAAGGAISGEGLKGIGLGAASGYAGNVLGNSISSSLTSGLSKLGASNALTNSIANTSTGLGNSTFGSLASNVVGPATGSSLIGGALGKYAGNSIANSLSESLFPQQQEVQSASMGAPAPVQESQPFEPKQEAQLQLPNSLSGLSGLDPTQQSTNIATQGVYGGGQGQQEQDYFTNLINRRLVDESGQVDQNFNDLAPIENSYLSQLGLGGYSNPSSLLEALNGRKKQAAYA